MKKIITRFAIVILSGVLVTGVSGCVSKTIPAGSEGINQTLFEEPSSFSERIAFLVPGTSQEDAFKILGISKETPNLERLDPEEMEPYTQNFESGSYTGWRLPYKYIKQRGYIKGMYIVEISSGFDLYSVLIFDGQNRLYRTPELYGVISVEKIDKDSYLWQGAKRVPGMILTLPLGALPF